MPIGEAVFRIGQQGAPQLVSAGNHPIHQLRYSAAAREVFLHVAADGLLFSEQDGSRWRWRWKAIPTEFKWAMLAPNGKWYATCESAGIVLRATRSDESLGPTLTREATTICGAVSPDSRLLAVAAEDGTVGIWDVAKLSLLREFRFQGNATQIAFDPAGRRLAVQAADRSLRVWDVDTGAPLCVPLWSAVAGNQLLFPSPDRLLVTGLEGAAEFCLRPDQRNLRVIARQIDELLQPGKPARWPIGR